MAAQAIVSEHAISCHGAMGLLMWHPHQKGVASDLLQHLDISRNKQILT